jgi:hypothetical protein
VVAESIPPQVLQAVHYVQLAVLHAHLHHPAKLVHQAMFGLEVFVIFARPILFHRVEQMRFASTALLELFQLQGQVVVLPVQLAVKVVTILIIIA